MHDACRTVGLSLLLLAPLSPLPGQNAQQQQHSREAHWTWFAGAALATRENTTFDPGVDVGVSVATAVSRPWSLRFDAAYAHAGLHAIDSSFTPYPAARDFDVVTVKATAIYGLFDPPFQDPVYRAEFSPYLLGGFGTYLQPGSTQSASLGIHGGIGFWFDRPPLESVELVGHDVVDGRSTQYVVLVARFAM